MEAVFGENPHWTCSFSYINVEVEQVRWCSLDSLVLARFTWGMWDPLLSAETAKSSLCQGRGNSVCSCTPQPHLGKQQLWFKKTKPAGAISMVWKNLFSLTVILEFGLGEFVVVQHWDTAALSCCFHLQKTWRFQCKIKFFSDWQFIDLQKCVAVNNSSVENIWFIFKHYWSFLIRSSLFQFVVIMAHHKGLERLDERKWV